MQQESSARTICDGTAVRRLHSLAQHEPASKKSASKVQAVYAVDATVTTKTRHLTRAHATDESENIEVNNM